MNLQPTLEDDLIILKPLKEDHFEALYEVAKDPLIWKQHPCPDRYKKAVYSKFFEESIQSEGALIIIEQSTHKVIGSTRFKSIDQATNAIEIGWSFLSRDKWGGKYNKAMKGLMIDYALRHVDHVIFYVGKENIRSQKAVLKLGGELTTDPNLTRAKKSELTFRIGKEDWT